LVAQINPLPHLETRRENSHIASVVSKNGETKIIKTTILPKQTAAQSRSVQVRATRSLAVFALRPKA
jgi:hypothetical protein